MPKRIAKRVTDTRQGSLLDCIGPWLFDEAPRLSSLMNAGTPYHFYDTDTTRPGTYMGIERSTVPMFRSDVPSSGGAIDLETMRRFANMRQGAPDPAYVRHQWRLQQAAYQQLLRPLDISE